MQSSKIEKKKLGCSAAQQTDSHFPSGCRTHISFFVNQKRKAIENDGTVLSNQKSSYAHAYQGPGAATANREQQFRT